MSNDSSCSIIVPYENGAFACDCSFYLDNDSYVFNFAVFKGSSADWFYYTIYFEEE